jgi:ankyrin repeat protein
MNFDKMLMEASRSGNIGLAEYALENGADINDIDFTFNDYSPLHASASANDFEMTKFLLENGADANNTCTSNSMTPLFLTSRKEIIELLISNDADIEHKAQYDWRPLYYASLCGKLEAVKVLLKHGANSSFKSYRGDKPICVAKKKYKEAMRSASKYKKIILMLSKYKKKIRR